MEACWAHNPEVRGSKPRSAIFIFFPSATLIVSFNLLGHSHTSFKNNNNNNNKHKFSVMLFLLEFNIILKDIGQAQTVINNGDKMPEAKI